MKISAVFSEVGRPIAYHARLNNITGSTLATLFMSQFLYWEGKQRDPDGWIYKTQVDIQSETGLSRREQEAARKQLKSIGFLEERRVGVPARLEYRLNLDAIDDQWNEFTQTGKSAALTGRHAAAQERLSRLKGKKNGSNPHDSQFVQPVQTRTYSEYRLERTGCTDNLYIPEMTLKDDFQRSLKTKKVASRDRLSVSDSLNSEAEAQKTKDNRQASKQMQSASLSIKPDPHSKQDDSGEDEKGRDDFFRSEKIGNRIYRFNARTGAVMLPKGKGYTLARAMACSALQVWLYQRLESEGFDVALGPDGRVYGYDPLEGEWAEQLRMLQAGKLAALAVGHFDALTQDEVNERAIELFETFQKWASDKDRSITPELAQTQHPVQWLGWELQRRSWDELGLEDGSD